MPDGGLYVSSIGPVISDILFSDTLAAPGLGGQADP